MLCLLPVPLALLVQCCRVLGVCWGLGPSAVFLMPLRVMFYSVIKSENSTLQQLWKRQFMLKQNGSFFGYIAGVIEEYHLLSADEILLLSKEGWKSLVKRTLRVYWEDQLRKEAEKKSTLERCHLDSFTSDLPTLFGTRSTPIEWM